MTTNQTIDGVPRDRIISGELLERLTNAPSIRAHGEALDELRALLDAPVCKACNDAGHVSDGEIDCFADGTPYENGPVACIKDCPDCKPAAQPQGDGEPVAWRFRVSDTSDWFVTTKKDVAELFRKSPDGGSSQPLYAEQPAPVAVVLPERREIGPNYPYLSDLDIEWNACLDKVTRLNAKS